MARQIVIDIEGAQHKARLNDTRIAELIWEALPFTASFSLWGEEIFFPIPVGENRLEKPQETVAAGDLGYWPYGHCFCIFYPAAAGQGPRVHSLLDAGFHRHDEVLLGFTQSGQAIHF